METCVCLIGREIGKRSGVWISKYLDPQGTEKEQLMGFTSDAFWNIDCYAVVVESWAGSVDVSQSSEYNFLSTIAINYFGRKKDKFTYYCLLK